MEWRALWVLSIVFWLLFAGIWCVLMLGYLQKADWIRTEGTCLSCQKKVVIAKWSRTEFDYAYDYKVAGCFYKGTENSSVPAEHGSRPKSIVVYYNPRDAKSSTLHKGSLFDVTGILLLGFLTWLHVAFVAASEGTEDRAPSCGFLVVSGLSWAGATLLALSRNWFDNGDGLLFYWNSIFFFGIVLIPGVLKSREGPSESLVLRRRLLSAVLRGGDRSRKKRLWERLCTLGRKWYPGFTAYGQVVGGTTAACVGCVLFAVAFVQKNIDQVNGCGFVFRPLSLLLVACVYLGTLFLLPWGTMRRIVFQQKWRQFVYVLMVLIVSFGIRLINVGLLDGNGWSIGADLLIRMFLLLAFYAVMVFIPVNVLLAAHCCKSQCVARLLESRGLMCFELVRSIFLLAVWVVPVALLICEILA